MRNRCRHTAPCLLLALALLLAAGPADAYLDPGTGSIVLQGVIAAIAAAGVALKLYWRKLRTLGRPGPSADPADKRPE